MPGAMPRIFECTVTSVQADTRTLDAKSRGSRVFKRISYLLPYMNSRLGSGFDFMPDVGDECIVLSTGPGQLEVVIGFKMPFDATAGEGRGRLRGSRMPPGSQGIRVVGEDGSEAKILAFRGGTVLIGSGSLANTIYTPLGEIKHLFDSYFLEGPGGKVSWSRKKGSANVEYDAEYRAKTKASAPGFRVNVHIGSGDTPISVKVTREKDDPRPALEISVDKDGRAKLSANILEINALARLDLNSASININGRHVLPQEDPI